MLRFLAALLAALSLLAPLPVAAGPAAAGGGACPGPEAGRLPALELPATRAALREGKPLTIIAFGSSSTEGAGASAPDRTYPARLSAWLHAALPGASLTVLNRGRGGEEVSEMLARLDRDVIALGPTLVVWQAGANAVLRGMPPEIFRAAMEEGLTRLAARGIDVVLMDSQRAPRIMAAPSHAQFDALIRRLAEDRKVPLFSRAALMRHWAAEGAPAAGFLGADGLHHNDRGYECLAEALGGALVAALRPAPAMAARRQ